MADPILTPYLLTAFFQQVFPGVTPQETPHMTGISISGRIWDFTVEVSLTTRPLTETDKKGATIITFRFHPENRKPTLLAQATVYTPGDYLQALEELKSKLMGVAATILAACEIPSPPPRKSFFD